MLLCKFCNKELKNGNSCRNHERLCKNNPDRQILPVSGKKINFRRTSCIYCEVVFTIGHIKKHEINCYLNPLNLKLCVVCEKPIIDYKNSKGTCSHSCSNVHFKDLRNKPERRTRYPTICFAYHEKKCVVCGETKIVAVHHLNGDRTDNRPENLIPMCPTHHQYFHSRYIDEVRPFIDEYLKNKFNSDS